ncbi:hypothetical protein DFQ27_006673 [Actinomortierella ambigua]|uniref:Spore coat protein CotH n=1 Tax=Actinomortierella ambigua TaxID=1343610 RepID=A0A9P6QJQ1_9FUNG|nr:hypothetical protein DFQ27_006673 [Actinomortierella ambigua]
MRIYLLSGLLALTSSVYAEVTYNVIGFPDSKTNTFAVEINKKLYPLETTEKTFPLWSAKIPEASSSSGYRYLQLNDKGGVVLREKFLRAFKNRKLTATANEFFNRQVTVADVPAIKQVYPSTLPPEGSVAFDNNQIGTIHLTPDPAEFKKMIDNPQKPTDPTVDVKAIKAGFKFINAGNVYDAVEPVKIKVSGHGSRKFEKLSLRIKFDGDDTFYNRPIIKLRSQVFDPTMIRERLYIDLVNSVAVPTYQGSYVRVFVNGKPHGFYLMVEDIEPPFLSTRIHHGRITKEKEMGSLYQMGSHITGLEATMAWNGSKTADYHPEIYENKVLGQNTKEEPMAQFIDFMKVLRDYDPTKPDAIEFWNSHLDLDGFLRSMALEFLTGHWDAYWWKGNNYFMYFNVETKVWQFIPTDFDVTFSDGGRADVDVDYKQFAASRLRRKGKDHPLITKLIYKNKDIAARFEFILKSIANAVFTDKVLEPRITAFKELIKEDVAWDYSIDRSAQPGKNYGWTISDFFTSIDKPVKKTGYSINFGIRQWINKRAGALPK